MKKLSLAAVPLTILVAVGCSTAKVDDKAANTATPVAESVSKLLATSPDKNFVLKGEGTCAGVYSISSNPSAKNTVKSYNLGYKAEATVPEAEDLGAVKVESAKESKQKDQIVFKNENIVVSGVITTAAEVLDKCKVNISEK